MKKEKKDRVLMIDSGGKKEKEERMEIKLIQSTEAKEGSEVMMRTDRCWKMPVLIALSRYGSGREMIIFW
jgi:hypothetical protein